MSAENVLATLTPVGAREVFVGKDRTRFFAYNDTEYEWLMAEAVRVAAEEEKAARKAERKADRHAQRQGG